VRGSNLHNTGNRGLLMDNAVDTGRIYRTNPVDALGKLHVPSHPLLPRPQPPLRHRISFSAPFEGLTSIPAPSTMPQRIRPYPNCAAKTKKSSPGLQPDIYANREPYVLMLDRVPIVRSGSNCLKWSVIFCVSGS